MNPTSIPSGHLDDGALVRLLDAQHLPGDDPAHVDACDHCRVRLAVLRERSDRVHRLAGDLDAIAPTPPADLWDRVRAAAG